VAETHDVLILSASYGGGHNQVAKAITQALLRRDPELKILTVDYGDLLYPFLNRLTQFSYMQSIRHFPAGYALYYQATGNISPDSFWQRRLNRIGYSELILMVNRLRPRVIISTFPLPAGVLSRMKEAGELNIPIVTVITDYGVHSQWVHPHTDLYLVGSAETARGLAERGITPDKIAVTGIPILPVFNDNFNSSEVKKQFGLNPEDRVITFMGGYDGIFGTTRFNSILKNMPGNVKAVVITGANQELFEKLTASSQKLSNMRIFEHVEEIAALMEVSDVLVTKAGGITISEALAKGLPMIIFNPTPGQEETNAAYLWRHRAAIVVRGEKRLKIALQRMVTDEKFRFRFKRNCMKLGKSDSASRCAVLILNLLNSNPKITGFFTKIPRRERRA